MPLHISEKNGAFMPIVMCDHCLLQIEDATQGNYEFNLSEEWDTNGEIRFTHKHCSYAFGQSNGGIEKWTAMELICLPIFLGNNLNLDWERAKEVSDMMGDTSL